MSSPWASTPGRLVSDMFCAALKVEKAECKDLDFDVKLKWLDSV